MPMWLKKWVTPPIFPDDAQKTHRARLLFSVTTSTAIFVFFTLIAFLVGGNLPTATKVLIALFLTAILIIHFMVIQGQVQLMGGILLLQGYLFITAAIASLGSIRAPIASAYLFLIIVAGALFEMPGIWVSTLLASLAIGILMIAEKAGLLAMVNKELTITQWVTYTCLFGLTGSMSLLSNQLTRESLERSRLEIQERKRAEEDYQRLLSELEQRVKERTAELSASNDALERASQMKSEFLAGMSHELRTPLTGILGMTEALELEVYGAILPKQLKALKGIQKSGQHLLDLINDVLDLSKVEAGELILRPESGSIHEICQASLHLVKGMAAKKQITVEYKSQLTIEDIHADIRRVKQMLVNLLSNAIKFTPEHGKLGLQVGNSTDEQKIIFKVWDDGIGIKSEDIERLFKPFIQIDSSLARQYSGTGLGLSLVARLVELHNGKVEVESNFGKGSTFTITLPRHCERSVN